MTAATVIRAVHTGAAIEENVLDVLVAGPLPLHEVATRTGRSTLAVEVVLRYLRSRGAVVREPGAGPGGVMLWRRAERRAP